MSTKTQSHRAPGELASSLHGRLREELFVQILATRVRATVVDGKHLTFSSSDKLLAGAMARLQAEFPRQVFKVTALNLSDETGVSVRTAERFIKKVSPCGLTDHEPGQRSRNANHRRREKVSILPEVQEKLAYDKVEQSVRRVHGRRARAYQEVLGHPAIATKRRSTGETPSFTAGVSRSHRSSSPSSRTNPVIDSDTHKQYHKQESALLLVPERFRTSFGEIKTLVETIPGKGPLILQSLISILAKTALTAEECIAILARADKDALSRSDVRDRRAWSLACLSNPDRAKKYLSEASVQLSPTMPSHPEVSIEPSQPENIEVEAITQALLATYGSEGMNLGGARAGAQCLVDRGVSSNWLPDFLSCLDARLRLRSGEIKSRPAYLVGVLKNPDPRLLRDGLERYSAFARLKQDEGPAGWGNVIEPLKSDLKAFAAYKLYEHHKATAPTLESPGFLDHYCQGNALFADLITLAEAKMGHKAGPLREGLTTKLLDRKIQPDSLVWNRAWASHWHRIVLEFWRIEPL